MEFYIVRGDGRNCLGNGNVCNTRVQSSQGSYAVQSVHHWRPAIPYEQTLHYCSKNLTCGLTYTLIAIKQDR